MPAKRKDADDKKMARAMAAARVYLPSVPDMILRALVRSIVDAWHTPEAVG